MKKAAALIILICMLLRAPSIGAAGERAQVGTDVSGFVSTDVFGAPVTGEVFGGYSVSVVTYWATWSEDCRAQLAILNEISAAHPEYGVFGLLYTDATSTAEAAAEFMLQQGYSFPVFLCDEVWQGVVSQAAVIPQSFIVNNEGMIVEVWHAAFSSPEILEGRLALWEAPPVTLPDGDADMNGAVESADALLVLRCYMGLAAPDAGVYAHADMDENGSLDSYDALMILRMVLLG